MSSTAKDCVVDLLETYQVRAEQIELLHFELSHPAHVSADEMIEAMSLARREGTGSSGGHISDKTLYIALNYQEQTDGANSETTADIVERLVTLEREQAKLSHCVSLLETRQARVIQMFYMKRMPMGRIEQAMGLSAKTIRRLKNEAVEHFAEMYGFLGDTL